jgi:hypothetical protein
MEAAGGTKEDSNLPPLPLYALFALTYVQYVQMGTLDPAETFYVYALI